MKAHEFKTYEDYIDTQMCGGSHIDECFSEADWIQHKIEMSQRVNPCSDCGTPNSNCNCDKDYWKVRIRTVTRILEEKKKWKKQYWLEF